MGTRRNLLKEEVPVTWIAAPITEEDIDILGVKQATTPYNRAWSAWHCSVPLREDELLDKTGHIGRRSALITSQH